VVHDNRQSVAETVRIRPLLRFGSDFSTKKRSTPA
jgi:hypothetical protein